MSDERFHVCFVMPAYNDDLLKYRFSGVLRDSRRDSRGTGAAAAAAPHG